MKTMKTMKRNLLLSDLDGTLTNKSLVLEHYGHLINKGIVTDDGSYEAWVQDRKNEKLIVQCAMSYQRAITGKCVWDLDVDNFIMEFVDNEENWYQDVMEFVTVAKDLGKFEVLLVTGSADFLVEPLCEVLGIDGFASIYKRELGTGILTGEVVGMFAEDQKDKCIQKNIDLHLYEDVIGIGDTASDFGIFKHCQTNYLVKPTKETLEKLILKGVKIDKIF